MKRPTENWGEESSGWRKKREKRFNLKWTMWCDEVEMGG